MNRMMVLFLLFSLLLGTSLVIISNHWFYMWLGLELSTLSILPLLSFNKKSRSVESTLKYFLMQAFSATILLKGAVMQLWFHKKWNMKNKYTMIPSILMSTALIMKLGLAPYHFWLPDVMSGLPYMNIIIIACWQKMAPLYLLFSISSMISSELLILCSILSVFMGGWGGLNQISIRKMLAYSSMSHLGWIICILYFSPKASFIMFCFYMLNNLTMILICQNKSLFFLSKLSKTKIMPTSSLIFSMLLLSLGGLPPLGGFLMKIIPLYMFTSNKAYIMIGFFLMGSLISLYYYIRMVFKSSIMLFPQKSMNMISYRNFNSNNINIIMSILFPFVLWGLFLFPLFFSFM